MSTTKKPKPKKAAPAAVPAKKKKPLHNSGSATATKRKPTPEKKANPGQRNVIPHQFKPGQSGNPQGARLHDPELRAVRNLTKKELADIGNLIIKGDHKALRKLAKSESATVLQRMLASVAVRIIDKGDMGALDILMNRLVGKVKDEVALTNLPQVNVTLPANGREAK